MKEIKLKRYRFESEDPEYGINVPFRVELYATSWPDAFRKAKKHLNLADRFADDECHTVNGVLEEI
ncbi:hypothetical protein Q5O14_15045 [Eubacteriaceae bacterium ES2]|nr:hypothetical protein Q5O14_15045 [Eubacteriaceae bacterium ES2]